MLVMGFGLRWLEFNKKEQAVTKDKFFKSDAARERFISKLVEKDNFYQIVGYHVMGE